MIKCIVCDLDGTLIKYDDTIEENTLKLLKECIHQNIEFMMATGRDINMVIDILNHYDLDCDLILNNGTQFCNKTQTRNDLYPMDYSSFKKIVKVLKSYDYLLAIHTNQGKFALRSAEDFWDYHMKLLLAGAKEKKQPLPIKTFTTKEGYLRDFHEAKSVDEMVEKKIQVLKIDARHIDASSIAGVREQLNIPYLDISSSFEDNIEITANTSNKGKLLEKVIQEKGYKHDEVAVFGDGENDVDMLKAFPYSFAPQNACERAKATAKYVLEKTSEQGAVGEGIERLKQMKLI